MKYQGYSLIKYCSTNLFPVYLREKISLKKYIRNNLSQTFIRCTFWYLKSWRNTKRKFLLQNGMSMAITVLILCVPWYQVNKNFQTNTNCMYIHSYEDLIIWYNDKTFFCWLLLESYWWFPMRLPYKSRPADMCILWCLAIEVTAMVQPTKIGITRKLYRPNLLFANVHHIKTRSGVLNNSCSE